MSDWEVVSVNKKNKKDHDESEWELANEQEPNQEMLLSQQQKPQEQSSILEDITSKMAESIPEIASGAMQLPGELKGVATHPFRPLMNVPVGMAEGVAGLWNLPVNTAQYLSEKGYLPKVVGEYAPYFHIPVEEIEKKLGIEAKEPGDALTRMLSGFGVWGKLGKFGEASALKRAGLGAGYAGGQGENPVAGAITALVPNIIKGGVKGWEYLKEPSKAITDAEGTLAHVQDLLSEHKEHGKAQETGMSRFINQIQEGLSNKKNQLESELPQMFPIKALSETRKNLSTQTNRAAKDLESDFDRRYLGFNKEHGHMPIKEPFTTQDLNLDKLKDVTFNTKNRAYGASHDILEFKDDNGKMHKVIFPAENSSVKDYVDFSREMRDAAYNALRSAKNAATHGDKQDLRKTGNTLLQAWDRAEQKIHDTVGDEPYAHYRNIQNDYQHLMGPIKTEPVLHKAAYKKDIGEELFNRLLQPVNERLRNHLYQNPEFTNALREHLMQGPNHPLTKGAQLNPAAINQDMQYLLTNEQKSALNEANNLAHGQKHLDQVSKNIKQPELLTARQEQNIRQFHPSMNEYLNNLIEGKETKASLENEQKMIESQIEELKRKRTRRKFAAGAAAGLGSLALGGNTISKIIKKIL